VDQRELAKVQSKFKVTMGVWATKNYFEYYKIHATIIRMFILEFFEQPTSPMENPWPTQPINQNYRTNFKR
jgi:hypothetical protein